MTMQELLDRYGEWACRAGWTHWGRITSSLDTDSTQAERAEGSGRSVRYLATLPTHRTDGVVNSIIARARARSRRPDDT